MDPTRWQQIESIYHQALEIGVERRNSFLKAACGSDEPLLREVESLLSDSSRVRSFMESEPMKGAARGLARHLASPAAPDWAGKTLGSYRIEKKIGEGGMGQVYLARDVQLDRTVAIKMLLPGLTADEERRQRFLREVKAASRLQHPGIVSIFDVNRSPTDGPDYVVMEYLAGKSLDQRIGPRGMKPGEAIRIAIQVADALAAAHAAGIVHRDLKPSNVMVTASGPVKILDFGLAKLVETDSEKKPEENEPGRSLTAAGLILGTPSYMSPEQASGEKVDSRTDIFSFGAMLYEMLTGRRAFTGDSHLSTLSAVLREDPKPVRAIVPDLPAELEKIVRRCLRKEPGQRFQHVSDLKVELEELLREPDPPVSPGNQPGSARRWHWLWAAPALLAFAAAMLWYLAPARPASLPAIRATRLTTFSGVEETPSFSPDGRQVAFCWSGSREDNWDIYVKMLNSDTPLRLTTDPAADTGPTWSPDGRRIFFRRRGGNQASLWSIDPLGREERKLADVAFLHYGFSCSPDGKWLAASIREPGSPSGIFLLPSAGGDMKRITSNEKDADVWPAFSPDGRRLAYVSYAAPWSADLYGLELGPDGLPKGQPRRITRENLHFMGIAWMPDSREIIFSASPAMSGLSLWRVGISGGRPPERMEVFGNAIQPAVSLTGNRLAFRHYRIDADICSLQRGELSKDFISSTMYEDNPQFSPDGKKIAFGSNRSGDRMAVWVCNADGSQPMELTRGPGRYQGTPRWSPDSRWIAFESMSESGRQDVFAIDAAGGAPRPVTAHLPGGGAIPSWSRDGQWIFFRSNRTGRHEIWKVLFSGGDPVQITDQGGNAGFESWEGGVLYYIKDSGGGGPLFRKSLSGGREEQVLSSVYARAFCVTGEGIYHTAVGEKDQYLLRFFDFASGRERLLFTLDSAPGLGLSVSSDRQTLLFTGLKNSGSDLMMVENFR